MRTPESLRTLIVEFTVAIAFTYLVWRLDLPMRGRMATRKDGPVSKQEKWAIVVLTLAIFILLAALTSIQRKQMGLPIF